MNRITPAILAAVVAAHGAAPADENTGALQPPGAVFLRSEAALRDGFPRAVIPDLRALAARRDLSAPDRQRALARLAEALLLAEKPEEVLALSTGNGPDSPALEFWKAQAFLATGQARRALEGYRKVLEAPDGPFRDESLLGAARASASGGNTKGALEFFQRIPKDSSVAIPGGLDHAALLLDLGQPEEAGRVLDGLADVPPGMQDRFTMLRARQRLKQNDAAGALLLVERISDSNPALAEGIVCLRAEALHQLARTGEAVSLIEDYLAARTGSAPRLAALETLERLRTEEGLPQSSLLRRLYSDEKNPARAMDVAFFLAAAEEDAGSRAVAIEILRDLALKAPDHPMAPRARLLGAELLLNDQRHAEALDLLAGTAEDPRAALLRGRVLAASLRLAEAEAEFVNAARDPDHALPATYNAALAALLRGVPDADNPHAAALRANPGWSDAASRFALDSAVFAARERKPAAGPLLEDLKPLLPAASLKLAEWKYLQVDLEGARKELAEFPDASNQDDAAALAVFLADDGTERGRETAIELALSHRARFPDSPRKREIFFKLTDLYFQTGNFLGARGVLEELAASETDPAIVAGAWFLAGKASSRLATPEAREQAMLAYEEAARAGGETAARARFEQALLLAAEERSDEALVVLERVLESDPPAPLREAALIEKGEIFYSRGLKNPDSYTRAAEIWRSLADTPGVSPGRADEALAKAGLALEMAGRREEAIQTLYRVFIDSPAGQDGGFWFYKAGFDAARMLEEDKAWKEAIAVYEKLAGSGGPRSAEAREKANRLRLANFLWED